MFLPMIRANITSGNSVMLLYIRAGEISISGAEGATASETLRPKDRMNK